MSCACVPEHLCLYIYRIFCSHHPHEASLFPLTSASRMHIFCVSASLSLHICLLHTVAVVIAAYVHWRVVLLLLEWRDASGGCAIPVTHGPLDSVLENMREMGHELLHLDQVRRRSFFEALSDSLVLSLLLTRSLSLCVRVKYPHDNCRANYLYVCIAGVAQPLLSRCGILGTRR